MGDRESAQLCRPRRPRGSPIYHPTEEHLEPFDRVYDDRFASSYGFWRSEIERTLLGSLE